MPLPSVCVPDPVRSVPKFSAELETSKHRNLNYYGSPWLVESSSAYIILFIHLCSICCLLLRPCPLPQAPFVLFVQMPSRVFEIAFVFRTMFVLTSAVASGASTGAAAQPSTTCSTQPTSSSSPCSGACAISSACAMSLTAPATRLRGQP